MNEQGAATLVPSGRYDAAAGEMSFRTNHFSTYAVTSAKPRFEDLGSTPWAQQPIEALAAKGIIDGVSDSAFNPGASITRGDFTKLLVGALSLTSASGAAFEDVTPADYYYEAVGTSRTLGIVNGTSERRFEPQALVTRQDMFVMIARALEQTGKKLPPSAKASLSGILDQEDIAAYAADAISALFKEGLIEGSAGKLHPQQSSTRAEASVMLYRVFKYVNP